ncbi:MAG: hypothetical protein ACRCWF_17750, partial [Beijerinckiaceae bacterium]
ASAFGGLIAGGVAASLVSVNGAASISGLAAGGALSTVTVSASGSLGASAFGVAQSAIAVSASCQPYGLGFMKASTVDTSVLTPQAIAASVWSALSVDNNTFGTMGAKVNASGAASDPWSVQLEGTYTAADLMRIMSAVLAGELSGGGTTVETFRSVDDARNVVVASVDSSGNRTSVVLTP